MSADTWEARMAARARERAGAAEAREQAEMSEQATAAFEAAKNRPWLNGWPRDRRTVRMGTGIHCVCCGRCMGVVCTVFTPDWEPPGPEPTWPFTEADCPIESCRQFSPTYQPASNA